MRVANGCENLGTYRIFNSEVRIVADGVGTGIDTVETTGKPVVNRVYNIQVLQSTFIIKMIDL